MNNIAVLTTFPNSCFEVYARRMLESYVANWPEEVGLLVKLDDDGLLPDVQKILRPTDGAVAGWTKEQAEFLERNQGRDDPNDYRKQACRFSHKVFALKSASDFWQEEKVRTGKTECRYLVWLDADVLTTRKVTIEDLKKCLPKEGDAVAYMGRKDWDHSECGWLAFDLENGGDKIIQDMTALYNNDVIFSQPQWHDSWIFDYIRKLWADSKATNLTPDAKGMDVWPQSPMASWSKHYKGPIAKAELANTQPKKSKQVPLVIQTRNSLPDESLCQNIMENQSLIKNWIEPCKMTDEEIVVVSAGPMLIAEDLREEAGRKIVAVKHALKPLKEAGIKPWACILLDPREHVYDFVENPDKDMIWFVASQVTPKAVRKLIEAGCNVWGYHAAVGAGESKFTDMQPNSIIKGGSATATRGMFVLNHLGFYKFRLYGYDLCLENKPDLNEKDESGQPKYFEIGINYSTPYYKGSRGFWSKGELLAQSEEFKQILEAGKFEIKAFGHGIAPFLADIRRVSDLREAEKKAKIGRSKPIHYRKLLGCKTKIPYLAPLLKKLL